MSFFKNVSSSFNLRSADAILKKSLLNNLSDCVKDIQYNNQFQENFYSILGSNDSTNSLCIALEAIFLHGLKDTIFRKAKNVLSGDPDQRPQPSFWPLVLVLSHRQNIDQISSLMQINTEVGQCRAWIRIALNECTLSSYIATLLRNISAVKPFYKKTAFVCDYELLELAQKLIEGLEMCAQFNLPINWSLLNQWPEQVLMLSGTWVPTMKTVPISSGFDIASTLTDEDTEPKLSVTPSKISNVTKLGEMLALNEDEALNLILSKNSDDVAPFSTPEVTKFESEKITGTDKVISNKSTESEYKAVDVDPILSPEKSEMKSPSITISSANLSSHNDILIDKDLSDSLHSNSSHGSSLVKTPEIKSLSSLVEPSEIDYLSSTPNLRDIMKDIHNELELNVEDYEICESETASADDPILQGLGFEVVPNSVSGTFTAQELKMMVLCLGKLSREYGLDHQNYKCKGCQDLLGSTVSKAKVCTYTGEYYCSNCMDSNVFIIPARVVHNWDFKKYPVSKKAAIFLLEFQHHPWIDMKKINPKIYSGVSDMAQLQELRIQLNYLKAYIFNCREPVIEEFQKRVWPREYLYDHVQLYTISDLAQIPNGTLMMQLEKVVNFAKSHVLECWLCSQKGFICEVCKDPKILYPFETALTFRCNVCSSVFHKKCLNASAPCPKCIRIKNRNNKT